MELTRRSTLVRAGTPTGESSAWAGSTEGAPAANAKPFAPTSLGAITGVTACRAAVSSWRSNLVLGPAAADWAESAAVVAGIARVAAVCAAVACVAADFCAAAAAAARAADFVGRATPRPPRAVGLGESPSLARFSAARMRDVTCFEIIERVLLSSWVFTSETPPPNKPCSLLLLNFHKARRELSCFP